MGKVDLKKDFFWNTLGTFINASTSFFFLIFVTRLNGTNIAGIFTYAFTLTLLIQIIGYYAGRVFQVTETSKKITDSDFVYNHLITSIMMIVVGLAFSLIMRYSGLKLYLIILLLIFRAMESFIDTFYAIIQKSNYLYKVGISFFLKGISSMISFFTIDYITHNVLLSVLSIIIVQLIIILIYDCKNLSLINFKLKKLNYSNLIYIFKSGFFIFLFTVLNQYVINSPKYSIDALLTNNDQTIYGIISMPATVMLLLSQFLIHPYINSLKLCLIENRNSDFKKIVNKLLYILIFLGVLAAFGAYVIGIPVLEFVYNVKLNNYCLSLLKIIIGSTFFGLSFVLSSSLIAMRVDKEQTIIYIFQCIISYLLNIFFIKLNGIYGAFDGYIISMVTLFIMYLILYNVKIQKYKTGR